MQHVSMSSIISHYNTREPQGKWFSKGAMRFFSTQLPIYAYRKGTRAWFVTSEQEHVNAAPRLRTVRMYDYSTKDVSTIGSFQQYDSPRDAGKEAKRLAKEHVDA